ncbi:uncharacterized protein LOC143061381 isoform X2 [Mytilus galloprovincialis]|uniref:uncharacterized protein LOC143061381 isoform X2 n=1 Tax=Mytilus galloprovincialis TaxID=29158 RepID=UPI003F7C2ECD
MYHFTGIILVGFISFSLLGLQVQSFAETIYYEEDSLSTDNCTNCWYGCDQMTGNCSGQCSHGHYSYKCEKECPSCYDCNKTTGDCTACRNRHYGSKCEYKCPEHCMVGCYISGKCYVCNEGYWGTFCNLTCPSPHCRNGCERYTGNCTAWGCYGGFWGNECNRTCPQNCGYPDGNGFCHQPHGTCQTCESGYSGSRCTERCNYENCSLCQFDVTTCYNCVDGWYGDHCDKKCPSHCSTKSCLQHTGKCRKCQNGFYGPYCDGMCRTTCDTCSDAFTCDTCKPGFHGENCQELCENNCKTCRRDGKCKTCKNGYFGDRCSCRISECTNVTNDLCTDCKKSINWYPLKNGCCPCSEHCIRNNNEPLCNQTGCINGCAEKYYGDHCIETCSDNCAEGNFSACNNETGSCEKGCKHGWHLPMCDFNCSLHYPHCKKCHEYTDRNNENPRATCHICKSGHYSEFLTSFCKPCENCIDDECDGAIGFCTKGCRQGWYAKRTRYLCENYCSENCADRMCDGIGGACINGCGLGFYGKHCETECPKECLSATCKNSTGDCTIGCNLGFYGYTCNSTCQSRCGHQGCNQENGHCKVSIPTTNVASSLSVGIMVLIVILSVLVIILLAMLVRVWCIRKRSDSANVVT